jgi:hypothetical protein
VQTRNADLQPARPATYQDHATHDNDNATPRGAASFSQRPYGRYHCACHVLSSVITRRPICQGGPQPPPASTIANSPQQQLHMSRVSFLRGRGMLARWKMPCLCCVAEPNCIDGWQAATCYSPALACPAPLSLHCHRLSPLLGALQMFPEKTA